ncbi:class F sortase [Microbacterium tumbae]
MTEDAVGSAAGQTVAGVPDETVAPVRRRFRAGAVLTTGIAVAGLALVGVGLWQSQTPAPAVPPPQRVVTTNEADLAEPIPASAPHTLRIPVIGFEADVLPLSLDGSSVVYPPTKGDSYWLDEYGLPGADSQGTVYLAGHSSADGTSVFDPLVDRAEGGSTLEVGDEILLDTENGTVVYLVQALERHPKTELADVADLWTSSPGRLVLLTCYYVDGASSAPDNFVVYARISPGSSAR